MIVGAESGRADDIEFLTTHGKCRHVHSVNNRDRSLDRDEAGAPSEDSVAPTPVTTYRPWLSVSLKPTYLTIHSFSPIYGKYNDSPARARA